MRKVFKKDDVVRSFEVDEEGRVLTTVQIEDVWISNPSFEDFLRSGWTEYIAPEPTPYVPTYSELVEQYIREHGYENYGKELAVVNNYSADAEAYAEEFAAYQQVRKEAKEWAKQQEH